MRKIVSGIMLTLLLTSMLVSAFNVPQVEASGTIYIRADGSVDPPTAPIISLDNVTYTLTDDIIDVYVGIQRNNIVLDGVGYTIQGTGSGEWTGIDISGRSNVTIKNTLIRLFYYAIYLEHSSYNIISGNNITNNKYGIYLYFQATNNTVSGNNIAKNEYGIMLNHASNNTISGNSFVYDGLFVSRSYANVVDNNLVNGKPLVYLEDVSDNVVEDAGQVVLIRCNRIKVRNLNLSRTTVGVELWETNSTEISRNNITTNNKFGIYFWYSFNNTVRGNNITANNGYGIFLYYSSNTINGNDIANNEYGIVLSYSSNNSIYHNNFLNNAVQVNLWGATNSWDDGYPSGGNYWSDYTDIDLHSGPHQNETSSDGIWDHQYVVDVNNQDQFPLVDPWTNAASAKGMWIYYLDETEGGNVDAIITRCKSEDIRWIAVKCADGRYGPPQYWLHDPSVISRFRNAGIRFLAWQYVYGEHGAGTYGTGGDPLEEAEVANSILDMGVDGFIIDAESEYEGHPDRAITYLEKIREVHPDSFVAYSTFPIIDYHPTFPYIEFGKYCDAAMPQAYWKELGKTPEEMVNWMELQWSTWQNTCKENGYGDSVKPIIPIGQGYGVSGNEIMRFCNLIYSHGYGGVSLWRYDMMTEEDWETYSKCFPPTQSDINHDGIVDTADLAICAVAFGSEQGNPHWNPLTDLAEPWNEIDVYDLFNFAVHFGENYP